MSQCTPSTTTIIMNVTFKKRKILSQKTKQNKKTTGRVAQVGDCPYNQGESLSSNTSTTKIKRNNNKNKKRAYFSGYNIQ
jgi:hypothetical protein